MATQDRIRQPVTIGRIQAVSGDRLSVYRGSLERFPEGRICLSDGDHRILSMVDRDGNKLFLDLSEREARALAAALWRGEPVPLEEPERRAA